MSDAHGLTLRVAGKPFMVVGMNWDYVPIGQNYAWSLWSQPERVIKTALDAEMPLLQKMGVNAIRQYVGIPPKWVRYIYEKYGIYTVLNHTVGRYGYNLGGVWHPQVDYSDPEMRAALTKEVVALVDEYKKTPGVLMWLLGNENNYGLTWKSAEIEALPKGEREAARARKLYSLFGEIITAIKAHDRGHPVAIANGDVQYIDVIAQECKGLDVFGANVYRGYSARDLFEVVKKKLAVPVMFTEFGADAYDQKRMREDDVTQARYLLSQWQEIYEQSAGKGRTGNAIGGFIFQWSDGWWKYKQDTNLDVHDTTASWPNAAYAEDFVDGENNMNEEWWGICGKGKPDPDGLFEEQPRTAYYALAEAFRLDPYAAGTDLASIRAHFGRVDPNDFKVHYQAEASALGVLELAKVRVSGLRGSIETYSTGGFRRVRNDVPGNGDGFGHTESFYADFEAHPAPGVRGNVSINVLGNVAQNPIDEIFYENRGWPKCFSVPTVAGSTASSCNVATASGMTAAPSSSALTGIERVKVYRAALQWDESWFRLDGFYRVGHYHWGYEGDFFGLYREANYGAAIDTYNADVPIGAEFSGKKELEGLKVAFGPALWWGANPAVIVKYRKAIANALTVSALYTEQFASQTTLTTSSVVPEQVTRKATLTFAGDLGPIKYELGGIWAGSTKNGETFYDVNVSNTAPANAGAVVVRKSTIDVGDDFGAKLKLSWEHGRFHWYASGAYMGLVADGGPTSVITFTGWGLKDSGLGNQTNAMTGLAVDVGPFQIGPNLLWQKPLIGPIPAGLAAATQRNVLDDPFAVRANREMYGAELMIAYDPTPATWLWAWDNDLREDAPFAASLDFAFKHQPTTQDSAIGVLADGTLAPIGAPLAHDVWEMNARMVGAPLPDLRFVAHAFAGLGQANGGDDRITHRYGADLRLSWRQELLMLMAKVNDWGPYDYYKDYNLTFPLQLMADLSHTLGPPSFLRWWAQTRLGIRGTLRFMNGYSPRFCPDPTVKNADGSCDVLGANVGWGNEWEVKTYLNFAL
jgi:hypothetical protein